MIEALAERLMVVQTAESAIQRLNESDQAQSEIRAVSYMKITRVGNSLEHNRPRRYRGDRSLFMRTPAIPWTWP